MSKNKYLIYRDLGVIGYKEAWDEQEKLFNEIIGIKIRNRSLPPDSQLPTPNYLLFCEHPHVFTLGKSGSEKNLLVNEKVLKEKGATFFRTNRGGDITYHGPGQIVGYPVFDLENLFTDIHLYMRSLEEGVILTLNEYNIPAGRISGKTGVWLDSGAPAKARKICAMGVRCSSWVTMHGFAFKVNTDLKYFNLIVPCGITDGHVTSLQKECMKIQNITEVKMKTLQNLLYVFSAIHIIEEPVQNNSA